MSHLLRELDFDWFDVLSPGKHYNYCGLYFLIILTVIMLFTRFCVFVFDYGLYSNSDTFTNM